jgi:hypothetical protein
MRKITLVLLITAVFGCNPKRIDTTQMVAEMKKVEVKRITPQQIASFANEWGNEIVKELSANKISQKTLEEDYKVKITKLDLLNIDLEKLAPKEKQILEATQYSMKNNIEMAPNLQGLSGGEIQLFTAPVAKEKNNIWRIEFSKKEIIQRAKVRDIKKLVTK